jgi:tryptophan halogenase
MHICVIGTGTAGLMAAGVFATREYVKKVTLIGSARIPTIGVGESTTLNFEETNRVFVEDYSEMIREIDAALKYGVYYQNWNEGKGWINYFKSHWQTEINGISMWDYNLLLGNLPSKVHVHDLCAKKLFDYAEEYKVVLDRNEYQETDYPTSWHFDAGKYITYITNLHKKNPKIDFVVDTVVDCKFDCQNNIEIISKLILESGEELSADFYINSTGASTINEKVFKEKYISLSDRLITNRALFYPLKYTNKREQFHPYTVAKTMNCGWRWITPTYSRIGTGYVYSTDHISDDDAIKEFVNDIGDPSIVPNVVDFIPRYSNHTLKPNSMTIGMANGFQEPLDAPGLSVTSMNILNLMDYFDDYPNRKHIINDVYNPNHGWNRIIKKHNRKISTFYEFWSTFIFAQYKNCHRKDTQFWIDYTSMKSDHYDEVYDHLHSKEFWDYYGLPPYIFQQTLSGRNIQWKTYTNEMPFFLREREAETLHHLDFINGVRDGLILV